MFLSIHTSMPTLAPVATIAAMQIRRLSSPSPSVTGHCHSSAEGIYTQLEFGIYSKHSG